MTASERTTSSRWRDWGPVAFSVGGLGTAFAAATCCGLPLVLGSFGVGSAWLFGIARRAAPHRELLLGIAVTSIAAGAWTLWRRSRGVCEPDAWCSRRIARTCAAAGLVIGAALALLGYLYG